jgi:hypothetical protein
MLKAARISGSSSTRRMVGTCRRQLGRHPRRMAAEFVQQRHISNELCSNPALRCRHVCPVRFGLLENGWYRCLGGMRLDGVAESPQRRGRGCEPSRHGPSSRSAARGGGPSCPASRCSQAGGNAGRWSVVPQSAKSSSNIVRSAGEMPASQNLLRPVPADVRNEPDG